jgi:hypothetical protein
MSALKTANARRQVGESTLRVRIKGARVSDAESYGTANLCTWPVGGGVCRFQTRLPKLAKKLSQRSGAQLVGWSVRGGYLRIFEEPIEPWRARHLVKRFLRATNGAFLIQNARQRAGSRWEVSLQPRVLIGAGKPSQCQEGSRYERSSLRQHRERRATGED